MKAVEPGPEAASADLASEDQDHWIEHQVPADWAGQRVDAVAARLFPEWSRARLQGWIGQGRLLLNGQTIARPRQPVGAEDRLQLWPEVEQQTTVEPQEIEFEVIHADEYLAVVNKPAGLTTHPGAGQPDGTLQNGLLHRFPQTAAIARAGIVHRLDKDTSGLLVVALDPRAHAPLVDLLGQRLIQREYDAVVHGTPVSGGTIDLPIGRHPRDRLKMAVTEGGRASVTHYRIAERYACQTRLRVTLESGRTHQIRVHLSHQRMPLVGDVLYGGGGARGKGLDETAREALQAFPRQALHARRLAFQHPISGEEVAFEAEPPEDMRQLLACLRQSGSA